MGNVQTQGTENKQQLIGYHSFAEKLALVLSQQQQQKTKKRQLGQYQYLTMLRESQTHSAFYVPEWRAPGKRWPAEIVVTSKTTLFYLKNPLRSRACWKTGCFARNGITLIENGKITQKGKEMGVAGLYINELSKTFDQLERDLEKTYGILNIYYINKHQDREPL